MHFHVGVLGIDEQRRVLLDRYQEQQVPSVDSTMFWMSHVSPTPIAIPLPLRQRSFSFPTQPCSPLEDDLAALSQVASQVARERDLFTETQPVTEIQPAFATPATPTYEVAEERFSMLNTAEDIARIEALFQRQREKQARRVEDSSSEEWQPEESLSESDSYRDFERSVDSEIQVHQASPQERIRHAYSKEEADLLGKNLRLLRDHHRLSREVVSREIRFDASLIWDVEQGNVRASEIYPALETFYTLPLAKLLSPDFEKELKKSPPPLPGLSNPRVIQRLKCCYTKEEALLIGKNLRLLRGHHKLFQASVAAAIGCDDTMISHIEKGRYPKSTLYPKFEEVYQIPMQKLLSKTFERKLKTAPLPRLVLASVQKTPEHAFSAKQARFLGENLRLLRVYHDVSQPAIAEEIDAHTNTIRYIEQGKACTSEFYPALEKLYGIPLKNLLSKMSPEDIEKLPPPPLVLSKSQLDESFARDAGAYSYSAQESMLLGRNLRVLRKHHKFPKASVAREIQCSKATFARIEQGTVVKSTFYKALEKVFKLSMQALLVEGFEEKIKEIPPPVVTLTDPQFLKMKTQERQKSLWPIIGKNIVALREHSHITYHRLAKLVKRDPKTIKRYEEGNSTIDPDVLQAIATHFKVSMADLEDEKLLQKIKKGKVAPCNLLSASSTSKKRLRN